MRISDWSSDVCSSDLVLAAAVGVDGAVEGNVRRGIAGEDAAGRVPDHLGRRRRRQAGRFAEAVAAGAGAVGTPAVVDGDPGEGLVAPAGIADGATALLWSLGDQINHGRTDRKSKRLNSSN